MFPRFFLTVFLAFFLFPLQVGAKATPKQHTFAVLPFTLHGPQNWRYLQDAVPEMLRNRLTWPDHFTPVAGVSQTSPLKAGASVATANQLQKKLKADYLIWGALSIIGENCSLDIQILDPKGKKKPFSSTCEVKDLIGHLEKVSAQINATIFSRPADTKNQTRINSQNLASTANTEAWRTQALNFPSRGMLVGDANGDGQKEFFLLKERGVVVYKLQKNRLLPIDEFSTGLRHECLNINFLPASDGTQKIVVSATHHDSPSSFILSFTNGKLALSHERIPYFLNVIKEPPLYLPALFGQKKAISRFLDTKGIVELKLSGQNIIPGRVLKLPEHGNIFNIVFLPEKDTHKVIIADKRDKLKVFNAGYELLATTDEPYAASGTAIEYDTTFAGGKPNDSENIKSYFIPTRLEILSADDGNKPELLVARNISAVGQLFHRYRNFSESEVLCLGWDGIGLNTVRKTPLLKGTSADYAIADLNGQKTLVVCVITHPGGGAVTRNQKTVLVGYSLQNR